MKPPRKSDLELSDHQQSIPLLPQKQSVVVQVNQSKESFDTYTEKISSALQSFRRKLSSSRITKSFRDTGVGFKTPNEIAVLNSLYNDSKSRLSNREVKHKSQWIKNMKHCLKYIPILKPNNSFFIVWRLLVSILIIYMCFEIPVYLVYGQEFWTQVISQSWASAVIYVSYSVFTLEMLLEFITAYYFHGNLVTKKSKIASNYLHGNFVFDLIAQLGLTIRISVATDSVRFFLVLFYFKLPALSKIYQEFSEMFLLQKSTRAMIGIFRILICLFWAFVTYGCGFIAIGYWAIGQRHNSWLLNNGNFGPIIDKSIQEQFFFSFYWALGTLSSTMGYGDVTPLNIYECSYALAGITFSVIIFSITINFMFKIIEEHNSFDLLVYRSKVAIGLFMKDKAVPNETQEKVKQYLNDHWTSEGSRDHDLERQVMNQLAPQLQEELMFSSYGTFLQYAPVFTNNFSKPFLKALSLQIQEASYSKGDVIFSDKERGQLDACHIYFINYGSVLIYPELGNIKKAENTYLGKLKSKQIFGEYSFFTGNHRQASAKANTYTQVFYIRRDQFLATLDSFPDDYEVYCQLRDKVLYNSDYSALEGQCWTCGSYEHYSPNCSVTHFVPSKDFLGTADLIEITNQRKVFKRSKPVERWHSIIYQKKLVKFTQGNQKKNKNLSKFLEKKQTLIRQQSQKLNQNNESGRNVQYMDPPQLEANDSEMMFTMTVLDQEGSPFLQRPETQPNQRNWDRNQNSSQQTGGNTSEQQGNQNYSNQQMELRRQFALQQQYIHAGLINFDVPCNYKKYFNSNNPNKVWNNKGQLSKQTK